ncbi:hypothetical protein CSG51_09045, partial [Campylobacter coli]|nr:hypothetical protein [Campylobacter coli]
MTKEKIVWQINKMIDLWEFEQVKFIYSNYIDLFEELRDDYFMFLLNTTDFDELLKFGKKYKYNEEKCFLLEKYVLNNTKDKFLESKNLDINTALIEFYNLKLSSDFKSIDDLINLFFVCSKYNNVVFKNFYLKYICEQLLLFFNRNIFSIKNFFNFYAFQYALLVDNSKGSDIYYEKIAKSLFNYYRKSNNHKLKPKIAVCFYGILRGNYIEILKENINTINSQFDVDYFLFSWKEFQIWPGLQNEYWCRRLTKNEIIPPKIIELYNDFSNNMPRTFEKLKNEVLLDVNIDEFIENFIFFKKIKFYDQINASNVVKLLFGIKNAIRLISEYELENYFHYDYVFVLRSDIEINEMSKNIINSLLFSEFNTIFENIGDGVAYGNRFVMDAYGSMYDKIEYILKNNFSVIGNHSFIP